MRLRISSCPCRFPGIMICWSRSRRFRSTRSTPRSARPTSRWASRACWASMPPGSCAPSAPRCRISRVGDEVFYAGVPDRPGTNAEFHLVDDRIVGHKPKSLSFAEAAALPLTALTAWEMLFERFRIPRDQPHGGTLLVVGGARRRGLHGHPARRPAYGYDGDRHRLAPGDGGLVPRARRAPYRQPPA